MKSAFGIVVPLLLLFPVCVQAADQRLENLRTLDSHFAPPTPASKQDWEAEAEAVRHRIRLATGVLPQPPLTTPRATSHTRREMPGYTIEQIYFESLPGFYVTGNLYRPVSIPEGGAPAVLSPHGHWRDGRFFDAGEQAARDQIAAGAERFEAAARNPIQARCVQLARMGCIVLQWDMIGHADSQQISMERAHGFREQSSAEERTDDGWLLYSPAAESQLQSVMGLQLLNTLQALRVVQAMDDVDDERIAITGASGGGTQTFIASAITPEFAAAFPAVMVSTGMQGGCTCENACFLRIGIGNIHISAATAPRPQGLTAADDWTRTMPDDGFPELQRIYALYEAKDRVQLTPLLHFGHNYNHVSRTALYGWINKTFELGFPEPVLESDFTRLTPEQLSVWNEEHPRPPAGLDFERGLLQRWHAATFDKVNELAQQESDDFESLARPAISTMLAADSLPLDDTEFELTDKQTDGDLIAMHGMLRNASIGLERPVYFHYPESWNGGVHIALDRAGIEGVQQQLQDPQSQLARRFAEGTCIVAIDLLGQANARGDESGEQPLVRDDRLAAAYTYGYNAPLIAHRVHDLLSLVHFVRHHERTAERVEITADAATSPVAALAGAIAGKDVDAIAVQPDGFRFENVASIRAENFLPGGARFLDLPGILALHAPRPLSIATAEGDDYGVVRKRYAAADAESELTLVDPQNP